MPFFEYQAASSNGSITRGEMEAADRNAVINFLKSENMLAISVRSKSAPIGAKIAFGKKISYLEKINFTGNLATMIKAGVGMTSALELIAKESQNSHFKVILHDVRFGIENGKPLSQALANYPKDFDPIFINMIQAGESSGKIEEALLRLNIQLKKEYSLVSRVKSALLYPAILICGVVGVLVIIVTFVIPRLAAVFETSTLRIPLTTRVMFKVAKVASFNPMITFAVLVVTIGLLIVLFTRKAVKKTVNRLLFRLPVSSNLLKNVELARFARTVGGLLGSGVGIAETLEIASRGMSLPVYTKIILEARDKILKGVSLANAFRGTSDYFPGMLISVIDVGEKTGELDKLLIDLAEFYEEQADNTLKTLTTLIEPVLLVIVGLLIGGMAVSIIVPIYQLIGTI